MRLFWNKMVANWKNNVLNARAGVFLSFSLKHRQADAAESRVTVNS
jgi:hypothetical protein